MTCLNPLVQDTGRDLSRVYWAEGLHLAHNPSSSLAKRDTTQLPAWECGALRGVVWESVGGDQKSFQVVG